MAKASVNSILQGLSGRIGNLIYKQYGDKVVVTRVPTFSGKWSPKQKAARRKFSDASKFADRIRSDPSLSALYAQAAKKRRIALRPFAIKDFLQAPIIRAIDSSRYRGCAGDEIFITTEDSFKVIDVQVVVRGPGSTMLEGGSATKLGTSWRYLATKTCARAEKLSLEAIATDRAGNKATRTEIRDLTRGKN